MSFTVLARLTALVLATVLLAGCTRASTGTARGEPEVLHRIAERSEPLTAREALGDFGTIDYCSLLDGVRTEVRGRFRPPADASFEYCGYYFDTADTPRYLLVGYLDNRRTARLEPGEPVREYADLPHELSVSHLALDEELCGYTLNFADGMRLRVLGNVRDATGERNCALARDALDTLIEVVVGDAVRHYTFPPNSFGTVRACGAAALLSTDRVVDVLGEAVRQLRWPSGHACSWSSPENAERDVFAATYFYTATPEAVRAAGSRESIGGRQSIVESLDPGVCRVLTTGIPNDYMVDRQAGGGLVEVAAVEVDVPLADDPCDTARSLAELVWPDLP